MSKEKSIAIRNSVTILHIPTPVWKVRVYLESHSFMMMNLELGLMSKNFKLMLCQTFKSVFL